MAATLQEFKVATAALPVRDRAELADYLIDSLDGDDGEAVLSEWLMLAERRMADVEAGRVAGIPAAVVMGNLLATNR